MYIQVHVSIYQLAALYYHVVIGLMHTTEDVLFVHLVMMNILTTVELITCGDPDIMRVVVVVCVYSQFLTVISVYCAIILLSVASWF